MSTEATAAYVEEFLPEDEPLLMARRNAAQVGGASAVSPVVGATLRFIAAALGAKAVVEIGTGCGTSGVWLLRGMRRGRRADQRRRRTRASAAGPPGVHRCRIRVATATG